MRGIPEKRSCGYSKTHRFVSERALTVPLDAFLVRDMADLSKIRRSPEGSDPLLAEFCFIQTMKAMTNRIQENRLKLIFFFALFVVLLLRCAVADAQAYKMDSKKVFKGFVASFGTRTMELSSSIKKINATTLMQAGGKVGLVMGNDILKAKLGLIGYYSSTGNTAGTTDLYESGAAVNFYPLAAILKRKLTVEPYVRGGVDYDQYKFYGYYVNREPGQTNYSQSEAPYLGKIKQVNATAGVGIEVRLKNDLDFIHLFSEVRSGRNLFSKSTNVAFDDTEINNQTQVVLGVSFGAHR